MTSAREWLDRFRRPAAAPAVPAVPAVPTEEPAPELAPVFAVLDEIDQEARALREEAEREAARRLQAASVEIEAVLARWQARAEAERARAEAEQREAAARELRAIEQDAAAEADRLRAQGLERIPVLVEEIVACVEEGLG
ncbi:MAG TPA: hypothetical protein VH816_02945 [Gaiellaceae bacterium]|jgi:hypothetical protein